MSEATCKTCPFWHGGQYSVSAVCSRNPPGPGQWPWTFPRDWCGEHPLRQRDRLAAMAMQGMLGNPSLDHKSNKQLARIAYEIADAMLAAASRSTKEGGDRE